MVDVFSIRQGARNPQSRYYPMSQAAFARRYGFTASAMADWEQGRRKPDPAARTLLAMIQKDQQAVDRLLGHKDAAPPK
ncbi:hypothetical protein CFR76_15165 [Komagataeibacter swingsii]|uniref:Transcriptional regulator n=1 Tax=Komagataeibacter swingsii TaxID=215220 RepID=A0A2V4RID3_9PROT|nr:hypothetical protein CFR76_15165 [Komagataeibacter swingsii]